jgi:uncharacterized NAD(P)/FAD-binding protein YdhS
LISGQGSKLYDQQGQGQFGRLYIKKKIFGVYLGEEFIERARGALYSIILMWYL